MTKSLTLSALISLAGALHGQTTVDLNGTSQLWNSSLGTTSGYPVLSGSTGISPATVDLGSGLTMTLSYTQVGTGLAYTQNGTAAGNLNRLDGTDSTPTGSYSPNPVGNELTGFAFSINSEGSDGNTAATGLLNLVRYDFSFNQPVLLGDLTVTDIDALNFWFALGSRNIPAFSDAVALEAWTSTTGVIGSGIAMSPTLGSALSLGTISGLDFAYKAPPVGAAAATDGGLTDSADSTHFATFSTAGAVSGFSLYYFDNLNNDLVSHNGGMTIGLQNFTVTQVPEPSSVLLAALALNLSLFRRRRA